MNKTPRVFPSSLILSNAERSHSGLVHRSRKPEWGKLHRGFKSHPLRQTQGKSKKVKGKSMRMSVFTFAFLLLPLALC